MTSKENMVALNIAEIIVITKPPITCNGQKVSFKILVSLNKIGSVEEKVELQFVLI